ncbi:MAG: lactonase family protein [Bryobacterales bacterium]|nr:lactonase family protein [Bryobacterales bacterium]
MGESHTTKPRVSRRGFLHKVTATAIATQAARLAAQQTGQIIAYVGAYTDRGKGIHMFRFNPSDGVLTPWKNLTGIASPSSIILSPNKKNLYAVNEISNYNGTRNGSVTAMAVQPDGDLQILNTVSSGGGGPAHIGIHPTGRYVFAANYGAGSVAVIPVNADGTVGEATDVVAIVNTGLGSQPAQSAPPGSFANSGHDAPHAHMAATDPSGRYLLLSDLGTDRIYVYEFNSTTGKLTPAASPSVQGYNGNGPRHFGFSQNGRFLYVLNEEGSTVDMMSWNANTGGLEILQSISSLPDGYEGTNYPSEIAVSSDGRFVYAANRLHDTIAQIALDPVDGWMRMVGQTWTRGSYPRHFAIDPTGNYMFVLHSRSDNLTSFRVDRATGGLTFTGKYYGVGNPSHIEFVQL